MSMISDPESWMGLRSARALEDEAGPPPAAAAPPPAKREPQNAGLIRRLLAAFRRL